jgi:hypothetical protein
MRYLWGASKSKSDVAIFRPLSITLSSLADKKLTYLSPLAENPQLIVLNMEKKTKSRLKP